VPYRIAHGQKALSLVLKHLWCHRKLPAGTKPPVCPVDRVMLDRVKPGHGIAWTKIDSMPKYEAALGLIEAKAGNQVPLAVFELFTFSGNPVNNNPTAIDRAQRAFLNSDAWAKPRGVPDVEIWDGILEDAIRSSHARARLYKPGTPEWKKGPFKAALRRELKGMGTAYAMGRRPLTVACFKEDVLRLRTDMNRDYPDIL